MSKKFLNKKVIVSMVIVIVLALLALAIGYAHNLYQMFLRVHGMG
jgi:cytochrome c oxidase assembly protein Cox11